MVMLQVFKTISQQPQSISMFGTLPVHCLETCLQNLMLGTWDFFFFDLEKKITGELEFLGFTFQTNSCAHGKIKT